MTVWMRRRSGVNRATITRVESTTARGEFLPGDGAEDLLQQDHHPKIDQTEQHGQQAVQQRAADDQVDIPQAVAQDGQGN